MLNVYHSSELIFKLSNPHSLDRHYKKQSQNVSNPSPTLPVVSTIVTHDKLHQAFPSMFTYFNQNWRRQILGVRATERLDIKCSLVPGPRHHLWFCTASSGKLGLGMLMYGICYWPTIDKHVIELSPSFHWGIGKSSNVSAMSAEVFKFHLFQVNIGVYHIPVLTVPYKERESPVYANIKMTPAASPATFNNTQGPSYTSSTGHQQTNLIFIFLFLFVQ